LLAQASSGKLELDRSVWLDADDIRPCCSLSRRHPNGGVSKTALEMLELMMIESDNTAADAVLALVGGPGTVERRLRTLGFAKINVNRSEGQLLLDMAGVSAAPPPGQWTLDLQRSLVAAVAKPALNDARARFLRDERDTATPWEMALLLGRLKLANLLPARETQLLLGLMERSTTGARRIKARLPKDTAVAHKTGTTAVVINDAGIITLPRDALIPGHVVLSAFVADGSSIGAMERAIASLSGAAFEFFSGKPLPAPPPRRRPAKRR
jgi:beta-lactamase class A